jgi:hypothetical protein
MRSWRYRTQEVAASSPASSIYDKGLRFACASRRALAASPIGRRASGWACARPACRFDLLRASFGDLEPLKPRRRRDATLLPPRRLLIYLLVYELRSLRARTRRFKLALKNVVIERGGAVQVEEWAGRYARAWEEADEEAAGALFTEDATYKSDPFREPYRGRDAIRGYWREVTATQVNVEVSMGQPMVAGKRAVVEWWTQMDNDGTPVTLPGALILDFVPFH